MADATGIVLAAGAGRRIGTPKALLATPDGEPWVARAVHTLRAAGSTHVVVVLGAGADEALQFVPEGAHPVVADDWELGMAASLRAGLAAASHPSLMRETVLVTLVDLPGLPVEAVRRVLGDGGDAATLRRAVYDERPGHPVLIGRDHWEPLTHSLAGDTGGQTYLRDHDVEYVDCLDLWDGVDVDLSPRASTVSE
jgi:CTP:molybdopterin cytidylyltransferase MocA